MDDEYFIVATNTKPHHAFAVCAQRWQIETLFGALKSRGFDLEATHLNRDERIEKLLALLAIAFAWAHVVGEWLHHMSPIPMKRHGRPAKSLFRYGLDHLRFALLNLPYTQVEYESCLRCLSRERVLSCT